ncbi:hypothetical protein PIB30_081118, partial [Stylosanthes scabra]|nr:hypothetical protein [Stylosanthes scabra]
PVSYYSTVNEGWPVTTEETYQKLRRRRPSVIAIEEISFSFSGSPYLVLFHSLLRCSSGDRAPLPSSSLPSLRRDASPPPSTCEASAVDTEIRAMRDVPIREESMVVRRSLEADKLN